MLICRTCLKKVNGEDCVKLNNNNQSLEIQAELRFCIPEVNFHLIEDAVMCSKCTESLHNSYLFKNECLRSEERIRQYILNKDEQSAVVIELDSEDVTSISSNCRNLNHVENSNTVQQHSVVEDLNNILDAALEENVQHNRNKFNILNDSITSSHDTNYLENDIVQDIACSVKLDSLQLKSNFHPKHTCLDCNLKFRTSRLYYQHLCSFHKTRKSFSCKNCNMSFLFISDLHRHASQCVKRKVDLKQPEASHSNEHIFEGPSCSYKNKKQSEITRHMITVHRPNTQLKKKFSCKLCQFRTRSEKTLGIHLIAHSNKSLVCNICGKTFLSASHVVRHKKRHNGPNSYFCSYCRFRTNVKEKFTVHQKMHA